MSFSRIIISRTDSIGDVVLTLPVAAALKKRYPDAYILFLGKKYTRAVVDSSEKVDEFIDWDEIKALKEDERVRTLNNYKADIIIHVLPDKEIAFLAKKAGIRLRLGTISRWYHWVSCNKLVKLSRRNSDLHEAQLNLKLIRSLTGKHLFSLEEITGMYGMNRISSLPSGLSGLLSGDKINLIIHPKSKGSAREWGLENFMILLKLLPSEKYRIFITGTKEEGDEIKSAGLPSRFPGVVDLTGKLSLEELISFIAHSDALVAASTGPLHLAAALGRGAVGIYPPIRPMHPGRWAPVGAKASFLVLGINCEKCRKTLDCECIRNVPPEDVMREILTIQGQQADNNSQQ